MCGIAGILSLASNSDTANLDLVRQMCDQIIHRGPDDDGYFADGPLAFGMRRLSIIDLAGGTQPIFNEDGQISVVFNGEIYNFEELRADLQKRGHRFSTNTDTEVIVHLYEDYGVDFADKLDGMFAIALWDARTQRLVLTRDRLGVKPLYYAVIDGLLVFGSEIKCLLAHPGLSRCVDPQAIYDYFCLGYIPQPRSIYRDVRKLPPAHRLIAENDRIRTERYWSIPEPEPLMVNPQEAMEKLRELLIDATRIRMISDVPLGAFLSGGIDSSITVALMAQLSPQPVRTFFIDFDDDRYSERSYARAVAARYGTVHHELAVRPDAARILDDLVHFFDEPFADSSAIPTYYLSQLARQHVTVALAGDGGDESFGGYKRYRDILARCDSALMRKIFGPCGRAIHRLLPETSRGRCFFRSLGMRNAEFFATGTQELDTREILSRDLLATISRTVMDEVDPAFECRFDRFSDPLARFSRLDTRYYLPDDVLTKVDRMSMAHSLEVRAPFLDYRVIEFAAHIPSSWKIDGSDTKVILKRTFGLDLPPEVLRPRKRGFSVPLADWLRAELRPQLEEATEDPLIAESGMFQMPAVLRMVREHMAGVRNRAPQLWRFLCFGRWIHYEHARQPVPG